MNDVEDINKEIENVINDIDETNGKQEDKRSNIEEYDSENDISAEEYVELLDRPIWENSGTGVEGIMPSFQKKTYGLRKSQMKLLMDNNKQEGLNDTNMYMNASVNVM